MRDREADRAVVAVLERIRTRAVAQGRLPVDPEPRRLARELECAWAAELNRLLDADAWLDQFTADELLDIACPELPRYVLQSAAKLQGPTGPAAQYLSSNTSRRLRQMSATWSHDLARSRAQ